MTLVIAAIAGCDHGPAKPPGLEDAGPVVAEFAEAAKRLDGLASTVAASSNPSKIPGVAVDRLRNIGDAARPVLDTAEPEGSAGVMAVQEAVAKAAGDVVRHLVTAAGGHPETSGRMALDRLAMVAFDTAGKVAPQEYDRSDVRMAEARQRLRGDLAQEIERFVYVALLASPDTRAAFAPRLSPNDLPAQVDPALNLPVATREEWRQELFDNQDRLVVPSPLDSRSWNSFLGWAEVVNPTLWDAVYDLTSPAFRSL
jgi:hypothetical protein